MTFLEEQIRDSLPVWEACLDTQFLRRLADGTLEEDCLKGYIVDDSLYLREYAKVFAWGMLHSSDMAEIRSYYSLLAFVNESEDATRRYYLRRYGITDEEIQPLPLRPENRAYVDYMIAAAREGQGAAECMMACLPCMLSYGWIFDQILHLGGGHLLLAPGPGLRREPVRRHLRSVVLLHGPGLPGPRPGAPGTVPGHLSKLLPP